tara:strand:- start:8703 stop:9017 length:315 start_codon:yes stop_codon:yes gene_type:complete
LTDYLAVTWRHENPDDPDLIYYEVQPDRKVTRMVEHFKQGKVLRDSLEISAERNPEIAELGCLCKGEFPAADQMNAIFQPPVFSVRSISERRFEMLFEGAEDNL